MKKLILTFAVLLFSFDLASAQTWLMVPITQIPKTAIKTADTSVLPVAVNRWGSGTIVPDPKVCPIKLQAVGCYMIQSLEDFTKVGANATSPWSKPTPTTVNSVWTAKGIVPASVPILPPPNAVGGSLLRFWKKIAGFIELPYAWAASGSDNFNRTSSNPISGSWDCGYSGWWCPQNYSPDGGTTGFAEAGTTGNPISLTHFTGFTANADQEVQATVTTLNSGASYDYVAVTVRSSRPSGTPQHYSAMIFVTNFSIIAYWDDAASNDVTISSDASTQWVAGDVVKLRIVGTALTMYRNGSSFLTGSDALFATGQPGMKLYNGNANSHLMQLDDWSATDVGGAAVVRHKVLNQ